MFPFLPILDSSQLISDFKTKRIKVIKEIACVFFCSKENHLRIYKPPYTTTHSPPTYERLIDSILRKKQEFVKKELRRMSVEETINNKKETGEIASQSPSSAATSASATTSSTTNTAPEKQGNVNLVTDLETRCRLLEGT